MFFTYSRESAVPYFNSLEILKFDIFKLRITEFNCKIINGRSDIPSFFTEFPKPATQQHNYNTRYAAKFNFVRTNYGIHTFKFIATKIWESIHIDIKYSCSLNIFF